MKAVKIPYRALLVSSALSAIVILFGHLSVHRVDADVIFYRLLWPLFRLMIVIGIGLLAGQLIEATGWARWMGILAAPVFRFANLNRRCSAAFTTAFFSGVAANSMLVEFYSENRITRKELFLTNLINQLPAYFLHLPTTFFIILPLTGRAGALYMAITLLAALLRTLAVVLYGHLDRSLDRRPVHPGDDDRPASPAPVPEKKDAILRSIRKKLPARWAGIAVYVIPIYSLVFVLNAAGVFSLLRTWLAGHLSFDFLPVASLSIVALSFTAEFTSGFAAAGALLDAGVLSTKQTVLALLIGNMAAFPVRALRHQLPHYMGIFAPKMGTQLLLMGQGMRLISLVFVGYAFYILFP
ncbi:MAG: nucleoside recognition protein [Desulfobacteraceae bacterium]|nr:MAG: nucleoside recognition protein [Desulfobacteraceae bacterium]